LLDAVSASISNHCHIALQDVPHMADFARWISAAETQVGCQPGAFLRAYRENRKSANELPLEHPVVDALRKVDLPWEGTASDLLRELATAMGEEDKSKSWPSTGRALSNLLRRLAPNLAQIGVSVDFGKRSADRHRQRLITLSENTAGTPSAPSASSAERIISDATDATDDEIQHFSVRGTMLREGTD
jgi:hypothetical protein